MGGYDRYVLVGVSVLLLTMLFLVFSDGTEDSFDHTGIVSDVRSTSSGFIFHLHTGEDDIRCFSYDRPLELGYYAVAGSYSDDGSIFFVSKLRNLDIEPFGE